MRSLPDSAIDIRLKLHQAAKKSGMTFGEIGVRMGFPKRNARKVVFELIDPKSDRDLRLSTLLAFADAIGHPLKDLL